MDLFQALTVLITAVAGISHGGVPDYSQRPTTGNLQSNTSSGLRSGHIEGKGKFNKTFNKSQKSVKNNSRTQNSLKEDNLSEENYSRPSIQNVTSKIGINTSENYTRPTTPTANSTENHNTSRKPERKIETDNYKVDKEENNFVTITKVTDGDTVDIRYKNGSIETVRLLGIDTPETYGKTNPEEFEGVPSTKKGRKCLEKYAKKAKEFMQDQNGERFNLTLDPEADKRGRYGRLLAYLSFNNSKTYTSHNSINYVLVKTGLARVYDTEFSKSGNFYKAEQKAKKHNLNLWKCRETENNDPETKDGDSGSLQISSIHADAAGNDHTNENNEYITFTAEKSMDLEGWTVEDSAGHSVTLPGDLQLKSGEKFTLYTGTGTDSESSIYWGSDSAIWNNGGDTIIVKNNQGDIALKTQY